MNGKRSDNQLLLAFAEEPAGEARPFAAQEVETSSAGETEAPVPLLEGANSTGAFGESNCGGGATSE